MKVARARRSMPMRCLVPMERFRGVRRRDRRKQGPLLLLGFGKPRGLLIAGAKRPLFTPVSCALGHMLGARGNCPIARRWHYNALAHTVLENA